MKTLKELQSATQLERFQEILTWVTTSIENKVVLEMVKKALHGHEQDCNIPEMFIISELACKGYLGSGLDDALITLAKVTEVPKIKTYKNVNFTKRNYECTNIVFCQTDRQTDSTKWVVCDEKEIAKLGCSQLYIQGEVRFFGFL